MGIQLSVLLMTSYWNGKNRMFTEEKEANHYVKQARTSFLLCCPVPLLSGRFLPLLSTILSHCNEEMMTVWVCTWLISNRAALSHTVAASSGDVHINHRTTEVWFQKESVNCLTLVLYWAVEALQRQGRLFCVQGPGLSSQNCPVLVLTHFFLLFMFAFWCFTMAGVVVNM